MPSLYRDLLFHAFDQYLRNFRTRKFRRRALPSRSKPRTFVPDKVRWSSLGCGQVLLEAMFPHVVQKKLCSKNSGVMPNSSAVKFLKISCAS